jgi:hypothetical protein
MENTETTEIGPRPPRVSTILVFVAAFAVVTSYLAVYACTNALISADIIPDYSKSGLDPRPKYMLNAFLGLFGSFSVIGLLFQISSRRQLKRIDALADED